MNTELDPPAASTNPLMTVGGLIGAAGGWALSQYSGASLLIPAVAAGLLALLFAKTPVAPRLFRGAIAVTGGHVVWFVAGGAITVAVRRVSAAGTAARMSGRGTAARCGAHLANGEECIGTDSFDFT